MPFEIPQKIQNFFSRYPDALDVFVTAQGDAFVNSAEAKAMRKALSSQVTLHRVTKTLTSTQLYPEPQPEYRLRYELVLNTEIIDQDNIPENGLVNLSTIDADAIVNIYLVAVVGTINITGLSLNGDNSEKFQIVAMPGPVTEGNDLLIAVMDLAGQTPGSFNSILGVSTNVGPKTANLTYVVAAPVTYTYVGSDSILNIDAMRCNGFASTPAGTTADDYKNAMLAAAASASIPTPNVSVTVDVETDTVSITVVSSVEANFLIGFNPLTLQP